MGEEERVGKKHCFLLYLIVFTIAAKKIILSCFNPSTVLVRERILNGQKAKWNNLKNRVVSGFSSMYSIQYQKRKM